MKNFLWTIFGNDDNPLPPAAFLADKPKWIRLVAWYLRNPCHNFMFYRVGIAKKGWKIIGRFGISFWPRGPYWFSWVLHVKPHSRFCLPFFSFRIPIASRGIEGYIGWRPNGALGGAMRLMKSRGY